MFKVHVYMTNVAYLWRLQSFCLLSQELSHNRNYMHFTTLLFSTLGLEHPQAAESWMVMCDGLASPNSNQEKGHVLMHNLLQKPEIYE